MYNFVHAQLWRHPEQYKQHFLYVCCLCPYSFEVYPVTSLSQCQTPLQTKMAANVDEFRCFYLTYFIRPLLCWHVQTVQLATSRNPVTSGTCQRTQLNCSKQPLLQLLCRLKLCHWLGQHKHPSPPKRKLANMNTMSWLSWSGNEIIIRLWICFVSVAITLIPICPVTLDFRKQLQKCLKILVLINIYYIIYSIYYNIVNMLMCLPTLNTCEETQHAIACAVVILLPLELIIAEYTLHCMFNVWL